MGVGSFAGDFVARHNKTYTLSLFTQSKLRHRLRSPTSGTRSIQENNSAAATIKWGSLGGQLSCLQAKAMNPFARD